MTLTGLPPTTKLPLLITLLLLGEFAPNESLAAAVEVDLGEKGDEGENKLVCCGRVFNGLIELKMDDDGADFLIGDILLDVVAAVDPLPGLLIIALARASACFGVMLSIGIGSLMDVGRFG